MAVAKSVLSNRAFCNDRTVASGYRSDLWGPRKCPDKSQGQGAAPNASDPGPPPPHSRRPAHGGVGRGGGLLGRFSNRWILPQANGPLGRAPGTPAQTADVSGTLRSVSLPGQGVTGAGKAGERGTGGDDSWDRAAGPERRSDRRVAAREPSAPAVDLRSGPGGGTRAPAAHRTHDPASSGSPPAAPPSAPPGNKVGGGWPQRGSGGSSRPPLSGCPGLPGRRGGRLGEPQPGGRPRTGLGPSPPRPQPGGREPPAPADLEPPALADRRRPQAPVPLGRGRCSGPPSRRHRRPRPPLPAVGPPPRASTHRENPPSSLLSPPPPPRTPHPRPLR
ncbi:basic proline-rich protein-like [Meles meles]|uniref:basic proline-rich protein-like n=1 Tax=Meles meles TaxID=9662 RepID=UPI001E69CC58|nr:basic proline-rich protein-like [Meles meles]